MEFRSDVKRALANATLLAVLLAVAFPVQLPAQVTGATVSGLVKDPSGATIPSATVSFKNQDTGVSVSVLTNAEGIFRAPNILAGKYDAAVSALGFSSVVQRDVVLTVGAALTIDFTLQVGATQQAVEVSASVPTVDTSSSNLRAVVSGLTLRELPLNGRDWTNLAMLQPGIAAVQSQASAVSTSSRGNRGWGNQLTVSGHRPQENNYRIDGVSINDYTNGSPGSVGGANLGTDAIAEFSVLQNNYTAEYGRTSGGVINAITRSGTNAFHGSGYEFARNAALDARNYFNPTTQAKPDFSRNQFGGSAGGPILRNRSFIFGDYEGIRQRQGVASVATVPSDNARQGKLAAGAVNVDPLVAPFLKLLPSPNAGLLGNGDTGAYAVINNQVLNEDFFTIRTDHHLSASDTLFGTYLYDKSTFGVPDTLNNVTFANTSRRQMAAIEETHVFTPSFVNTVRVGYNRTFGFVNGPGQALNSVAADISLGTVPGLPPALINISGITSFGGLGTNTYANHVQNSYQVYDDAFLNRGKHSLKVGFAFERIQYNEILVRRPNGSFSFANLTNFLTNRPRSVALTSASVKGEVGLRTSILAGYFNDDWRVNDRLTLNLGLRYEFSTKPVEANGQLYAVRNIFGGPQANVKSYFERNPTTKNFEPRIGLAWDPTGRGKTSVRAAFGMFDALPLPWVLAPHAAGDFPFAINTSVSNLPQGTFPKIAYTLGDFSKVAGTYVEPNPSRSYIMNWHLTVQHQLPGQFLASVGYVGSHSLHNSFGSDDVDIVPPIDRTPLGYVWPSSVGTKINPAFGLIRAVFFDGSASYHGLQAQVNRQMARGLQAQASYTWSHCIDTGSSGPRGDTFSNGFADLPWFDRDHRRGACDFDLRHNLVVNSLWTIPAPAKGLASAVLGNWQLGGIFTANTGTPFTVIVGGDPLGLQDENPLAFPDWRGGPGCSGNPVTGDPRHYIKTECFAMPIPSRRQGTSGRNNATGPTQANLNFALYKNIPVSERFGLQFRAELFNALNHPNFAPPLGNNAVFDQTGAPLGSAGLISSTQGANRQIQLGVRARW